VVDVTRVRLSLFKSKQLLGLPLLDPRRAEEQGEEEAKTSETEQTAQQLTELTDITAQRERRRAYGSLLAFIDGALKADPGRAPQVLTSCIPPQVLWIPQVDLCC